MQALKEDRSAEHVIGCKVKGVYTSKPFALYTAFLQNIKRFGHKIGI